MPDYTLAVRVCSTISLVGCFVVLWLIARARGGADPCLRSFFRVKPKPRSQNGSEYYGVPQGDSYLNLVAMITVNDALFAIATFIGPQPAGPRCKAQGFFTDYLPLCSVCWTAILSYHMQRQFVGSFSRPCNAEDEPVDLVVQNRNRLPGVWYVIGQGLPFVVAIVSVDKYAPVGGEWCWIPYEDVVWRLTTYYLVVWVVFLYILVISCFAARVYCKLKEEVDTARQRRNLRGMFYFPIVLILCYAAGSVNRVYEAVHQDSDPNLYMTHVVMQSLQGFFNAVVMLYGQQVIDFYRPSLLNSEP